MKNNHLKALCIGLIIGLSFHTYASFRIEKVITDTVTLRSQDGQDFTILEKLAKLSLTIRDLTGDADTTDHIPLPNVNARTLALITELLPRLSEVLLRILNLKMHPIKQLH